MYVCLHVVLPLVIQDTLSYTVSHRVPTWSNPWFDWLCHFDYVIHVWMLPHPDMLQVNPLHINSFTMPFSLFLFFFSLPSLQCLLCVGSVSGSYKRLWFYTNGCTSKSDNFLTGKIHHWQNKRPKAGRPFAAFVPCVCLSFIVQGSCC